jgi:hypothetical protein
VPRLITSSDAGRGAALGAAAADVRGPHFVDMVGAWCVFFLLFTAAFYARARARAQNLRYRARASAQVKHHAVHQSPAGQQACVAACRQVDNSHA